MKLKKMVLHNEHEVMKNQEMKLVFGGIYIQKDTCQKSSGICSGTCYDRIETDPWTGVTTKTKMTCGAFIGADPTQFICGCKVDLSIP